MGSLAAILLPMIPGLISSVTAIISAIQSHPDTPAAAAQQLADIAAALDATAQKVAAVQV